MNHVNGVDISAYQESFNAEEVKAAGYSWVSAKATEGLGYTSSLYAQQKDASEAAGLLFCAYHFMHWNQDPRQQAAYFLSAAEHKTGMLKPMLDCEWPCEVPVGLVNSNIRVFSLAIKNALGVYPTIYCSPSFWLEHMGATNWFINQPLWVANYGHSQPPVLANPGVGFEWKPTFWQYSDLGKVAGISGSVDVDWFLGTMDQLQAMRLP